MELNSSKQLVWELFVMPHGHEGQSGNTYQDDRQTSAQKIASEEQRISFGVVISLE